MTLASENQLEERVILLALSAHKGKTDKVGQPYILHCLRVGMRGQNLLTRITGYLHDTLEDTDLSVADIRQTIADDLRPEYVDQIIEALETLTRHPEEQYGDYVERVCAGPTLAVQVKLYDLADNLDPTRLGSGLSEVQHLRHRYSSAVKRCQLELTRRINAGEVVHG